MRSSSDGIIKLISVLIFTALILYMCFAFLGNLFDPLETIIASNVTLKDALQIDGYIVREETVLSGDDSYIISVSAGSKVSDGQEIAVKYSGEDSLQRASRIKEIKTEITQLETKSSSGKSSSQLAEDSIISLSKAVNGGSMSEIELSAAAVETHIFGGGDTEDRQARLEALKSELSTLESEASSDTSYIRATAAGIFSPSADGYESVTYDDLKHIAPSQLHTLFEGKEPGPDTIGKIVTGLNWYCAVTMDEADAERLEAGMTYDIDFSDTLGRTVTMTADYVGPPSEGKSIVIFSSDKFVPDVAPLRLLSGNITFSSFTGISVPKDAVHYDEDGTAYVYVLVGLQARRADVTIKEELEDACVVEAEDGSLLRTGAEIITKGRKLFDGKVVK